MSSNNQLAEQKNIAVKEDDFIGEINTLISKNCYPLEHFTLIDLSPEFPGEYTPALIDYFGNCIFIGSKEKNECKTYKSRGTALKRLGDLWTKAEKLTEDIAWQWYE